MGKLLFLQSHLYEYLGPVYVASALKSVGHEAEMFIGNKFEDFEEKIARYNPDLIGFSVMTGNEKWALDIAKKVKTNFGIRNVFGGAHPTFFQDFLKEDGVDMVVRGEGEFASIELLNAIEDKKDISKIENLGFKKNEECIFNPLRPLPADLDVYPFPDRTLYRELGGRIEQYCKRMITSRGCPFKCTFCFEEAMQSMYKGKGKYTRFRRIDKIIEEALELKNNSKIKMIDFCDDLFGMNKKWLREFAPTFRRDVGLPFMANVRADIVASDPSYAKTLKLAGCQTVFFGIESGNEKLRNLTLRKQLTDQQIINAAEYLHAEGIAFRTYNIFGLPGETLDDGFLTIEINRKIKTDYPWASMFSPLPGVPLTDYSIDNGYLDSDFDAKKITKTFFLKSALKNPQQNEIQNLQRFFSTAVLFPWSLPIIKKLIRLRPNVLFDLWFAYMYGVILMRTKKLSMCDTLKFAFYNVKYSYMSK